MKRRIIGLLMVFLLTVFAAGCGGAKDSPQGDNNTSNAGKNEGTYIGEVGSTDYGETSVTVYEFPGDIVAVYVKSKACGQIYNSSNNDFKLKLELGNMDKFIDFYRQSVLFSKDDPNDPHEIGKAIPKYDLLEDFNVNYENNTYYLTDTALLAFFKGEGIRTQFATEDEYALTLTTDKEYRILASGKLGSIVREISVLDFSESIGNDFQFPGNNALIESGVYLPNIPGKLYKNELDEDGYYEIKSYSGGLDIAAHHYNGTKKVYLGLNASSDSQDSSDEIDISLKPLFDEEGNKWHGIHYGANADTSTI